MTRTGSRRDPSQTWAGAQFAFTPVARPNLAVIIWRWRYEIILATGVPASAVLLAGILGAATAVISFLALAGIIAVLPPARRLTVARAWCVITPHRFRTGCAQAWIHTRHGKIPIILRTSARPYGERIHLWCRAGTSIEVLGSAGPALAAACWARDLQFTRSSKYAHLVTADVIRQPPFPAPRPDPVTAPSWRNKPAPTTAK